MSRLHPNVRAALDDIKAHPADDTPRLMLADWLEEHGETESERARGTVLRLGCQAAARPTWDPRRIIEETQVRLLFRRHRDDWLGDLPAERFTFHRGLLHFDVGHGEVSFGQLHTLATTSEILPWVARVEVNLSGGYRDLAAVALARRSLATILTSARQLVISGFYGPIGLALLEDIDPSTLTTLHLRYGRYYEQMRSFLSRPFTALQDLSLPEPEGDWFTEWPALRQLRALHIEGEPHAQRFWPQDPWPALEELSLQSVNPETFARGENWPRLRRLSVRNNGAGRLPAILGLSSLLGRLESLDLHCRRLGPSGLAALGRGGAASLRTLRLGLAQPVHPRALPALFAGDFPSLRELNLARIDLDSAAVATLASSPLLGRLESLDISGCNFDATAGAQLGSAAAVGQLRHLSASWCPAGRELLLALLRQDTPTRFLALELADLQPPLGWSVLQGFSADRFPELIGLRLGDHRLSSPEILAFSNWSFLRQIRVLDIGGGLLPDAAVQVFLESPQLREAVWVHVSIRDSRPDLKEAWRDRFGRDSVLDEIPF
jgi:uncharacterized protein (TIGR02996 family)